MITYIIAISAVLYRRVRHPDLFPSSGWRLGRWGIPVNIGGLLYSSHAFFWCFWPEKTPVTLGTFNWAAVMFIGVAVLCTLDYLLRGKKHYKGPVVLVQGYKTREM